jgi:type II secretory pathway pseudopilin PulG
MFADKVRATRSCGFTLLEAMLATALTLTILLVVGESIRYAVRSHRRGEAHRQAVALGREVLNRLTQEMATSISLGILPNGGELQSGVVYPDYARDLNTPFGSAGLYRRERVNKPLPDGSTVGLDRAYNRLIFTTPGRRSGQFNDSLSEFVFVEFLVPPQESAPQQPQGKLLRRTFRVQPDPLASDLPGLMLAGAYEVVRPLFFAVQANDPLGNANMLEASLSADQRRERCLIAELPRPDDELQFSVEHTAATILRTTPLPRDPVYEPALFTVSVSVALDRQEPGKFLASQVLSQQVTIKSGF